MATEAPLYVDMVRVVHQTVSGACGLKKIKFNTVQQHASYNTFTSEFMYNTLPSSSLK